MQHTIYLATDHAGFEHKNAVRDWLQGEGYIVTDCGNTEFDAEDDYTDYISLAVRKIANSPLMTRAIIFGGSGQGEAMLANRFAGVRAAVYYGGPSEIVTLSREHNDANVLSIGARFVSIDEAKEMIWLWLTTDPLPDKKYKRRISKMRTLTDRISDFLAKDFT